MAGFLLCLFSMIALSLGMSKHARDVLGQPLSATPLLLLKVSGWLLLLAGMWANVAREDWSVGLVQWIGQVGLAAFLVALTLAYWPRCLPWFGLLLSGAWLLG